MKFWITFKAAWMKQSANNNFPVELLPTQKPATGDRGSGGASGAGGGLVAGDSRLVTSKDTLKMAVF